MLDEEVPAIRIKDVSVLYGAVAALKNCSLQVGHGELLCLVGPSGCGKSTLLKVIAGFLEPTSGTVEIEGRDVGGVPVRDRNLAYIMDRLGLYPHLRVFDNIAYPLRVRRIGARQIASRVSEVCKLTGIAGLERRRPQELSAGQRQRVAVARALVRDDAVVLLADESFSNLDAQLRYQLRTEFRTWQRSRNLACIFVTHDQEEALSLGDRVALMNAGAIEQIGTAGDLYEEPASLFTAGFFGRPPCNLIPFTHPDGKVTAIGQLFLATHPQFQAERTRLGKLMIGFRPEFVRLNRAGEDKFDAVVDWLEPMMPDTIVHAVSEGFKITARVSGSGDITVGQRVSASVESRRWLLFDQTTGIREKL